ncbi:MAG TPA: acyl-CoA thioester hydrolase/BAAT C-terminal domain-containing protein, partial [Bacteroidales bacterium]
FLEGRIFNSDSKTSKHIVINTYPCLSSELLPESEIYAESVLRNKLVQMGVTFLEFGGRKDSIQKYGHKYPASTLYTKADDLDSAIAWIHSQKDLKDKKIVVMGSSEGGSSCVISASRNPEIDAVVLLATPAVRGKELEEYQHRYQDTLITGTFGSHQSYLDFCNKQSSLKAKNYEQSIDGYRKFREDMYSPLEDIVHNYTNYDTIVSHLYGYLQDKWSRENEEVKNYHKTFENYCNVHQFYNFILPQQIAIRTWNPELYYVKIKCPVLTVNGTQDKRVEYKSNIQKIGEFLKMGGNEKFKALILKDYDHSLVYKSHKNQMDEVTVNQVVKWIVNQ